MRSMLKYSLALSAVALVAACDGASPDPSSAITAELRRDLELAQATGVELAPRAANVVDAGLELAPQGNAAPGARAELPAPRRQAPPARVPRAEPRPAVAETPIPAPAEEVAATTESPFAIGSGDAEAPAPMAGSDPVLAGGPVMVPTGGGSGTGRDPGGWGGGTGVVIRGGSIGDDDHCQYHWPASGRRPQSRPSGTVFRTPDYGRPTPVMTGGRTRSAPTIRSRGPAASSPAGAVAAPSGGGSTGGRSRTGS